MMTESIMVVLILSIVIILLGIWLKMSIKPNSEHLNVGSIQELNEKRDIAAQVPLLNQTISELQNDKVRHIQDNDNLQKDISKQNVYIAELKKDQTELEKEIDILTKDFAILKEEKIVLSEKIEILNGENIANKNLIERKEYEYSSIKSEKEKSEIDGLRKLNDIEKELLNMKNQKKDSEETYIALLETNSVIRSEKAKLEADIEAQEKNNQKLKEDFTEQSKRLELKLGEIMQNTLDSKIKKFDETSIKGLGDILKPFKENLDTFKKKVEEQQESSIEKFASLSKEIEGVNKIGLNIGKEAENLAIALKGKKQKQGSWGEMILESVLEHSGLLKGTHYETQSSYRDSEGNIKRPDVVVKLPQDRTIIIDSKVSLNDYNQFIQAESEEEQNISTKAMVIAFKNHIDILADKDYAEYKIGTLQYIFMFIPIEGAFATAVQSDPHLYEYALQKNIAIVNPSTLTVSLRTIYLYWQSEQSSTLAIKLFEEAGKLYDKMDNFAKSFKKIGTQLQTVNKTYDDAHKKLTEGTGNVLGRVEKLKQLGARTKGKLNDSIEFQSTELDMDEIEVTMIEDVNGSDELIIDTKEEEG